MLILHVKNKHDEVIALKMHAENEKHHTYLDVLTVMSLTALIVGHRQYIDPH